MHTNYSLIMISFRPAKLGSLKALLSSVWMELTRRGLQPAGGRAPAAAAEPYSLYVCPFTCVLFMPTVADQFLPASRTPGFPVQAISGEFPKMHANALFNLSLVIHIRRITSTLELKNSTRFLIFCHFLLLLVIYFVVFCV